MTNLFNQPQGHYKEKNACPFVKLMKEVERKLKNKSFIENNY